MRVAMCGALMLLLVIAPAFGWDVLIEEERELRLVEPTPADEPLPPATGGAVAGDVAVDQLLQQMGLGPQETMLLKLLTQGDVDPMTMMLLMPMLAGGHVDEDVIGMLLFSKMMQQGRAAPPQPVAMVVRDALIIVDDGTVYRINLDGLTIEAKLAYKPTAQPGDALQAMLPLIMSYRALEAQPEPPVAPPALPPPHVGGPATAVPMPEVGVEEVRTGAIAMRTHGCEGNLRRLCLGAAQYAADNQNMLPGVDWPVTLAPYVRDTGMYQCPAVPELAVAFVINEAVAGLEVGDIADPGHAVLFFESDLGTDLPIGGPEALVGNARHEGKVAVGFVDGHTAMMTLEEARTLLGD